MSQQIKRKRPFLVTLLAAGVLMLTVFNAIRFGAALAQWDLISRFMPRPGPFYIATTGLVWTLGLLGVALSLWCGWTWARPTTTIMVLAYTAYYWFDRLIYQYRMQQENLVFALGLTLFVLLFTAVVLSLPGSRKFFRKRE